MDIAALSGIILIAAAACVTLRKYAAEYSVLINITAGAVILAAVLSKFMPAVCEIRDLIACAGIPREYGAVLFKSLGICFMAQFASDACADAGESSLSSKIELAGKAAVIIAALPLFEKVTETALHLMGGR